MWEGQSGLTPHLIVACRIPQTFPRLCLRLTLLLASTMRHIGPCQSLCSRQTLPCIFGVQAKLQAHTPEYSHMSSATLKTYFGTSMYGMNMLGTEWGGLNSGNETSGSGSCSELDNSSWLFGTISSG